MWFLCRKYFFVSLFPYINLHKKQTLNFLAVAGVDSAAVIVIVVHFFFGEKKIYPYQTIKGNYRSCECVLGKRKCAHKLSTLYVYNVDCTTCDILRTQQIVVAHDMRACYIDERVWNFGALAFRLPYICVFVCVSVCVKY